jgi:hypothetical protein
MARTEDVDEPGGQYQRVVDLLGGSKVFSQRALTPLDAHMRSGRACLIAHCRASLRIFAFSNQSTLRRQSA